MEESNLTQDPAIDRVLEMLERVKGQISVQDLDTVLSEMAAKEAELDRLAEATKALNKVQARFKSIVTQILKELGREEYTSPFGKVAMKTHLQVKMPESVEAKLELFDWMRKRGIYDRYATVHAVSLKALYNEERRVAAEELGADFDPVTFTLPGLPIPTYFEQAEFKPKKD